MFVRRLELGGDELPFAGWADVEGALAYLRANEGITLLLEVTPETWYMDVFAAENDLWLVSVFHNGITSYLSNPRAPDDKYLELDIGGQLSAVSLRRFVDEETVLRAVRTFFDTGLSDPALPWETR